MSPTMKVRKNNPFGYREQEILEDCLVIKNGKVVGVSRDCEFLLSYFHAPRGNFYVPVYDLGGMQYYLWGGQIEIIG